jgi:hypothetical protein
VVTSYHDNVERINKKAKKWLLNLTQRSITLSRPRFFTEKQAERKNSNIWPQKSKGSDQKYRLLMLIRSLRTLCSN